jgi:hypothetical protein
MPPRPSIPAGEIAPAGPPPLSTSAPAPAPVTNMQRRHSTSVRFLRSVADATAVVEEQMTDMLRPPPPHVAAFSRVLTHGQGRCRSRSRNFCTGQFCTHTTRHSAHPSERARRHRRGIQTYRHKYIHTYIHTHIHTYIYIYIYIYICVRLSVFMCAQSLQEPAGTSAGGDTLPAAALATGRRRTLTETAATAAASEAAASEDSGRGVLSMFRKRCAGCRGAG